MPCDFNDSALHSKTDPEIRDLLLPSILDRFDLSFDAPCSETSWHKDAVGPFEKMFRPLFLYLFRINIFQIHSGIVGNPPMDQSLSQTLIGFDKAHILSYDRNCRFISGL